VGISISAVYEASRKSALFGYSTHFRRAAIHRRASTILPVRKSLTRFFSQLWLAHRAALTVDLPTQNVLVQAVPLLHLAPASQTAVSPTVVKASRIRRIGPDTAINDVDGAELVRVPGGRSCVAARLAKVLPTSARSASSRATSTGFTSIR